MILYFANRGMTILELASSNTEKGLVIDNDDKVQDVDTGAVTFEFDIYFNEDNRESAIEATKAGNYILKKSNNEYEFYTIIDKEVDTKAMTIHVYAEDEGLDLLNEVTDDSYSQNTTAYTISQYVTTLIYDTGFEIGLDEIGSTRTRTLQWEAGNTATAQLDTVANAFEAELSFSFTIEGLKVTKKYINIHSKRGTTDSATIRLDSEVDNITIKESVANLATCYRVTGGTPDGAENPVTLAGYSYDDGDFYVNSSGWLMSRNALSKWSRYQWEQGLSNDVGHIVKNFTSSLTDQKSLLNSALASLKKVCDIQTEYEIDISLLPDNVKIGDTINIVDEKHRLYVNARVLKLEVKESENSHVATLGSYVIKTYDVSSKLQQMSEDFTKNIAQQRALAKAAKEQADTAQTTADSATTIANEAKEKAVEAITKSTEAINKSTDAVSEANQANQSATEAKNSAVDALDKVKSATADLETAKSNIETLRTDVNSTVTTLEQISKEATETKETLDGLSGDLQETKETLEASYAKKTDLSSTEATLKAEITKSATELSTNIEKTYAGKSEVTEIQGKLQSQITQNANGLTSQASKIETLQNDTADAQTKITAASTEAANAKALATEAQTAADNAKKAADDAQSTADTAKANAATAQEKADAAKSTADEAQTRLKTAESDLSTAKENLKTVTADVNATKEEVEKAQTAVTEAEKKVTQAVQDASDAQTAASAAQTAANTAKSTAESAQTTANTAKENANSATKAASDAKSVADEAQKAVASLTSRVSTAETNIQQNSEAITESATKVTEIGDKLTNDYYSKTETDAKFKIESDKISSTVSRVEIVEQKAVTSSVEEFYLSTSPTALSGGSWSISQPTWSEGKYIWRRSLVTKGDGTISYSPSSTGVCITGNTGNTGKGIKSSIVTYQGSTSGTTVPTGTWSTSVPTVAQGSYLWIKTVITYTDNTTYTSYAISYNAVNGTNGKSIGSVTNYYLATNLSSGVTTSTSGWTTAVQNVSSAKKYLWNYEVIKYSDNTVASTSTPCIIGAYGDTGSTGPQGEKGDTGDKGDTGSTGNGISSITEHYQVSSSNTTPPASWSNTVPAMTVTNKYLWNYETITYTNGTFKDTTKRVIGVYGNTGDKGDKGDTGATGSDGKGIVSITKEFYLSTSKTGQTGGAWSTVQPSWVKGKYLWTREKIVYENPSSTEYTTPKVDSSWEAVNDVKDIQYSDTEPSDTTRMWFDTANNLLKYWNGSTWEVSNDFAGDINDMKQQITTEYTSAINQLKSSISTLVESLQTTTTDNTSSIERLVSQIQQNVDSIEFITSSVNEINNTLTGVSTKEEISKWARFKDGILELGASNSPFAVKLSNTELGFYQNGSRIAYLSNQQLNISQAVVMKQINIGTFQIVYDEELGLLIL